MPKLDILIKADNQASGPIGTVTKALNGLGGAAKTAVMAAGVAATASVTAVVGAIGVGVGKAAELEQGVADIASVMGVTFDEAKPLGDLIQSLGMDPKLKVDALGASDAIMQLAQSGISMADILDGAARSTVLLSNATGGDMATSAAVIRAIWCTKAEVASLADMAAISGQKPVITKAKKSIAAFKLRQGQSIGAMVTLRGPKMYDFLDRLMNLALPRLRDFRGISRRSFDGRGNYSLGLREQIIFPEIDYDKVDKIRGLEVAIVTNAPDDAQGYALLKRLGMPFRD